MIDRGLVLIGRAVVAVTLLLAWGATAADPGAAAKQGLTLGINDEELQDRVVATRTLALDRSAAAGAHIAVLDAQWREIAQGKPAKPRNPKDPAYNWRELDPAVRDATARGLQVMIMVHRAPDWAEGPRRPADAREGTWRPSPARGGP